MVKKLVRTTSLRLKRYGISMLTVFRQRRAAIQLAIFFTFAASIIIFLDNRYRVLPSAIHNHLPAPHAHGYVTTDINIITCSKLGLFSKCALDGPNWHRVNKDLYLGTSYTSKAYLYVARKKEDDLKPHEQVLVDIRIGRLQPSTIDAKASKDSRWVSRPFGLWLKLTTKHPTADELVTGVDVLFGADAVDPRSNWAVQDLGLFLDSNAPEPRITFRKGPALKLEKPVPRIRKDGKFKILQVSDMHLSTGLGVCRDTAATDLNAGPCDADPRTLDFIEKMLEEEKPDFVVLSGDQVNGDTAPDAQTAIFKYSALFARHRIPHAAIFGNHDDEGSLTREETMALIDGLPYSLSTAGPSDVDGVGNYHIEIFGRGTTTHSALTLYLLDSHSYSLDEKKHPGYDYIHANQISWFINTSNGLKRKHREYTHIHMDLAFIHIPLPEYRNPHKLPIVGNWTEDSTAPGFNSGFLDALISQNVLAVSCGHDHVNDYCVPGISSARAKANPDTNHPAIWMCYGGGAGFGGYGRSAYYHRRVRVFEMDMNEARITTWKRLECCGEKVTSQRWDELIIVDGGQVVVY
ncbi:hypothetical protein DV736_g4987, partial [Chaetothyriales sp. CBS 134916]